MAHLVFFGGRKLAEGFAESFWHEYRIVTKAAPAARRIDDNSFDNAVKRAEQFALKRQRDDATETRRPFRPFDSRKLCQ